MKNERPASIEAVSVTKRFGTGSQTVTALDRVSLTIDGGEFFTLLGPSGCGKTTLLRMVAGFERPDEGGVRLAGTALGDLPPFRRPVNTVFQSYALFPHLSVARNVAFGLEMQGRSYAETEAGVVAALAMVRMAELAGRLPRQLSGGQQQRVALARALACRPRVLLLDEPLSALDLQLRKEMQGELRRLKAQTGITFLFVTHDQEEALTMSDRLAVMDRGRVLQVGTPAEIYDRPANRFVAGFIGETNFIDAPCTGTDGPRARFELPGGGSIVLERPEGVERGGTATLAIRPERVEIVEAGGIVARLDEVVYLGTDSVCHLSLTDGSRVRARLQNRGGWRPPPQAGATVQLRFPTDALRALPA